MALRRRLDGDDSGEKIVDLGFKIQKRASTDRHGLLRQAPASA
jgi:LacI family gluconate utilization system Gnt-I transcriptional repressor